jgi:ankyrin repeat protein
MTQAVTNALNERLWKAFREGPRLKILDALVDGADPDCQDEHGRSMLYYAVSYDNAALIRMLLDAGGRMEPEKTGGDIWGLAVDRMCRSENDLFTSSMMRRMLKNGANPDQVVLGEQAETGRRALTAAINNGKFHSAMVLLEAGADITVRHKSKLPIESALSMFHLQPDDGLPLVLAILEKADAIDHQDTFRKFQEWKRRNSATSKADLVRAVEVAQEQNKLMRDTPATKTASNKGARL